MKAFQGQAEFWEKRVLQALKDRKNEEEPVCAYIYDLDALSRHLREVMDCLPPRCQMYYAMKANPDDHLLREVSRWVDGIEVASEGELTQANQIAAHLPKVFGGPGKTDQELRKAVLTGAKRIHVESRRELIRLNRIAGGARRQMPVLLRVNLRGPLPGATLQMAGEATPFGIQEGDIPDLLEEIKGLDHIRLDGFHFHSVSNQMNADDHLSLIQTYYERSRTWSEEANLPISTVNVGGGIGVNYQDFPRSFDWLSFTENLREWMAKFWPPQWKLMFECGRFLTAFCGTYVTQVLDIKENHGETFAIVRGGTHHFRLPASWGHSHPLTAISHAQREGQSVQNRRVHVAGQLCTPKDRLASDVWVDQLQVGDWILFLATGAYGWTISHHDFLNHPHPDKIYLQQEAMV
ncbi:type III PLP-dependent enzyme [Kroppenstedtia pulmonis]|uniref:Type III PLP-dependent enzyme n=1 Tax=Kroppenstedtia pulmonis TaxID=1380685 RepID=A0A7D4CHG3_9BACL|nr:type III PLP-dependent enzyme [Kroppenstedtia pulmonis]QKG85494.1 type III PLP-dependent enzyme [Kroppenstedtia pulmonis]